MCDWYNCVNLDVWMTGMNAMTSKYDYNNYDD